MIIVSLVEKYKKIKPIKEKIKIIKEIIIIAILMEFLTKIIVISKEIKITDITTIQEAKIKNTIIEKIKKDKEIMKVNQKTTITIIVNIMKELPRTETKE